MNGEGTVLVITEGLPGSGKTTWARERGYVLVGRDHIRWNMLGHGAPCTRDEEDLVTVEQRRRILGAWVRGEIPCADDTSLFGAYRSGELAEWAKAQGATVIWHRMETPLSICLARNKVRPSKTRVPDLEIIRMWARMKGVC